jgi:hypothetical protein
MWLADSRTVLHGTDKKHNSYVVFGLHLQLVVPWASHLRSLFTFD